MQLRGGDGGAATGESKFEKRAWDRAEILLMRLSILPKCGQGMQNAECLVVDEEDGRVWLPGTVGLNLGEPRFSANIRRRMQTQNKTKEKL